MDDPKPWLTLARVPGLHAGRLAHATSDPLAWLEDSRTALAQQGFREAAIGALHDPDPRGLERDEAWLAGPGRSLVAWGSADYPPLLAAIPDAPLVLFVATSVPIVVSRSPAPIAPIPVAAASVAVPLVVRLAVSANVMSVIAPPVAVTLMALEVVVISPSATFVAASSVTFPLPVE